MNYNLILLKLSKFKIVLIFRQRVEMREIIDHRGRICASLYTTIKQKEHLFSRKKSIPLHWCQKILATVYISDKKKVYWWVRSWVKREFSFSLFIFEIF